MHDYQTRWSKEELEMILLITLLHVWLWSDVLFQEKEPKRSARFATEGKELSFGHLKL